MPDLRSRAAQSGLALLAACAGTRATDTVDAAALALPSASVSADGGPEPPDASAQPHDDPARARSSFSADGGSPTDLNYEGTYRSGGTQSSC
jgi:hypothetical protein